MGQNPIINSENIVGFIQRTLNEVDPRLVDHGIRVAFLVAHMLEVDGGFSKRERQDISVLGVLHDVGAYKTEEIDRMVQFENSDSWEHPIYGYLFLLKLSPLKEWAQAVLYHHAPIQRLPHLEPDIRKVAQLLNLADRMEILHENFKKDKTPKEMRLYAAAYLEMMRDNLFSGEVIDCFLEAESRYTLFERLKVGGDFLKEVFPHAQFTEEECASYLRMLIYAIDFRSQHTVTHTITTASISVYTARCMGIPKERIERIYYGALLHDLGKIGIPVEILEFPGKLSVQAMTIMKTHVDITERILGGSIARDVTGIALRHHERLDGSGYPCGLLGEETTMEEQIVAVADITSALLGTRSYKEAFSRERTLEIIGKMAAEGKVNKEVVEVIQKNFDKIIRAVSDNCAPVLRNYYSIQAQYRSMLMENL